MPRGNGVMKKRKRRSLDLSIPLKAISTNKLYSGKKVRSVYYRKFRKEVFTFLRDNYPDPVALGGNLALEIEVGVSSPLSDLSNSLKGIEDCISEFYKFNDRQIVTIKADKFLVNKGEEYMILNIKKSRKNIDRRTKGNGRKPRKKPQRNS